MTDREYLDQLILSLRVRDVPPERIREIVDEVTAHLAAGDEHPVEAFGPPSEFAGRLAAVRPRTPRRLRARAAPLVTIAAGTLLAVWLALEGSRALLTGSPALLTLGDVLAFGVLLAAAPMVWWLFTVHADGRLAAWPVMGAGTAVVVAAGTLAAMVMRPPVVSTSGWLLLGTAVLAGVLTGVLVRSEPLTRGDPPHGTGSNADGPQTDGPRARDARFDARFQETRIHGARGGVNDGMSNLSGDMSTPSDRDSPTVPRWTRGAEARLTRLLLGSPGWRTTIVVTLAVSGAVVGLSLARATAGEPPVWIIVALLAGFVLGHIVGAARVRARHGLVLDRTVR
jgi:hypothetical protein